jgi:cytoskeletal protein CcmA (bactofilin family)
MRFGKKLRENSYSTVSVNGKTIRVSGNNIAIVNDQVLVNGKVLDEFADFKNVTIIVEGNCHTLRAHGNVEVKGNCGSVDCSGSCHIDGNVEGNVDANGSVTCGDVAGDIDAHGSVRCTRK